MYTVMVIDHRNGVNESFANSAPMATVRAARAAMTKSFNDFTRIGAIYKTKGKDCAMAFEPDGWVAWFVADVSEEAKAIYTLVDTEMLVDYITSNAPDFIDPDDERYDRIIKSVVERSTDGRLARMIQSALDTWIGNKALDEVWDAITDYVCDELETLTKDGVVQS